MQNPSLEPGLVIASHGRHVWVEKPDGSRLICHPRGKKSHTVVGDHVLWKPTEDEGTIEKVLNRRNLFYRQDEVRTKSFASNLDLVLILIAAEPEFSESQLARALIAAEAEKIQPLIVLNKSDLSLPFAKAWERLGPYRAMGYPMLPMALKPHTPKSAAGLEKAEIENHQSFHENWNVLNTQLQEKVSLVLGPSGSGKSTLINRLIPQAQALTQEISTALNSGKHTTTSTTLYWVGKERKTAVIDSPGFQEFGLNHIEPMHLAHLMPDMHRHSKSCKFYNCTHLHEPGCGVLGQITMQSSHENISQDSGHISPSRYFIYQTLFAELSFKRY